VSEELVTGAAHESSLSVRSEEERLIDLRILPWGEIGQTSEGRERVKRGAFRGVKPEDVSLEAIGPHGNDPGVRLAGRAVSLEDREDGQYGTFRVSRTHAGDELLELARDGVYRGASAVFRPVTSRMGSDGVIERHAATLVRVGIVERGAYSGAAVLAVRSAGGIGMTEPTPVPDPTPDPVPDPEPNPVPRVDVLASMDALRNDLVGRMAVLEAGGSKRSSSPASKFRTFGEYADAAYHDPSLAPLMARVLVDQITSENPGVMGTGWAGEIAGILTFPRPAVTAFGGPKSLGSSGMELNYPYLDPALDLDTLVAKQAAEKSDIASVKVKILRGSNPIETFAGGSDLSYQLIRRSDPAYREAYLRILAIAYARRTEAEFEADLEAGAGGTAVLAPTANAAAVRAFLFAASSQVAAATGSPATFDLVSSAEFARLGGLPDLMPPQYGTSNQSGTASASTLAISISGLPIIEAPFLTGNVHLVSNSSAAGWHEDGPFPISAEDVAKLGQNVALWGMGATAITVPAGIVKSSAVAGRGGRSSSSES
jgi:HK97 family phage prohead protease